MFAKNLIKINKNMLILWIYTEVSINRCYYINNIINILFIFLNNFTT